MTSSRSLLSILTRSDSLLGLDRTHHLAKLIVTSAHSRVQHNGVKETLSEVHGKFWILKGRSLVKKLIGRCVICPRFEGLPFSAAPAPPLPGFRVNEAPPFMQLQLTLLALSMCREPTTQRERRYGFVYLLAV